MPSILSTNAYQNTFIKSKCFSEIVQCIVYCLAIPVAHGKTEGSEGMSPHPQTPCNSTAASPPSQ